MIKLSLLYFLFYFCLGGSLLYFSNLFETIGMNGKLSGTVFALGSLLAIFWQPIVGFLADKTKKSREILALLMAIMSLALGKLYFAPETGVAFYIFLLYSLAIWGFMPLIDSVTVSANLPFGKIRLWGSIGFAAGSFASGKLIAVFGITAFLIFIAIVASITAAVVMTLPEIVVSECEKVSMDDIKKLIHNPNYALFIFFSIMILGGLNSHNTFFSLYFQKIGGGTALFGGVVFFLTMSEVPFMGIGPRLIEKHGTRWPLILAGIMYCIRWGLYYFFPYPAMVAITFFLQGASVGLFFGVAAAHIKNIVDRKTIATAMTTFMAAGTLGGTVIQFVSGIIIDRKGVLAIYLMFMILSIIGTTTFALGSKKSN